MSPSTKGFITGGMQTIRENEKENDDYGSEQSQIKDVISKDRESASN